MEAESETVRTDPWNSGPWAAATLALLTLAALALRLWGLTHQSLWIDEMFTLKYAGVDQSLTWENVRINLQGPLHSVLLHVWSSLFGWGEASIRLPQAIVSAATVPMLYAASRPVFGERRALLAAALLAVNPFHVWYAQEVRNYAFVIFLATLSLWVLQGIDGARRPLARVPALAATWLAGMLFNLSFAFHAAAGALWGAVRWRRDRARLAVLGLTGVVVVIALLPWEVGFYQRWVSKSYLLKTEPVPEEVKLRGEATAPVLGIPYAMYAFSVGFSLGPSLRELRRAPSPSTAAAHPWAVGATAVCFGTLAVAGGAQWIRGNDARRRLWLLALLVPLLLAFLAATRNLKVFNPRYVAVGLPIYMVALAEGVFALRPRWLGDGLLAGVAILCGVSLVQLHTEPRYWKEDARSAAKVLRAEMRPEDLLFVVGTCDPLTRYYWPELRSRHVVRRFEVPIRKPPQGDLEREAVGAIEQPGRTFVLFYREDFHDPDGRWEAFLKDRFAIERRWDFVGTRVWLLGPEKRS